MAVTEAEAAVVTEADEEEVEVEELDLELERAVLRQRGPRRRTSWTWPSTWTRPSSSSSTAVEKVIRAPRQRNNKRQNKTKQTDAEPP